MRAFVTENGLKRRINTDKIRINVQLVHNIPTKKDVRILLDRSEVDAYYNSAKNGCDNASGPNEKLQSKVHQTMCLRRSKLKSQNAPTIPSEPERKTNHLALSTNRKLVVALPHYKVGDVVWCKLKGSPNWPAKVKEIYGKHNQMLKLVWFNDNRLSAVHQGQVSKFCPSSIVTNTTDDIGVVTAIKEAIHYLISKM